MLAEEYVVEELEKANKKIEELEARVCELDMKNTDLNLVISEISKYSNLKNSTCSDQKYIDVDWIWSSANNFDLIVSTLKLESEQE